jgi:hypothetical protein
MASITADFGHRGFACEVPIGDRLVGDGGFAVVLRDDLRPGLYEVRKPLFQRLGDAAMQGLSRATQQGAVGGILDQRVLEQIFRRRRGAALEDQASLDEAAQSLLQFGFGVRHGRGQQLIGKVAPDCGADLRHTLGRRTEPVEAPQQ